MEFSLSLLLLPLSLLFAAAFASDADPLQDFCVADLTSEVRVNGYVCRDASRVYASDFFSDILAKPGDTNNTSGFVSTAANVQRIPGLNTLGVSLSRIDFAPGGYNPPHTHPRATEMVFLLEGELLVGFITTSNRLISRTIRQGETFVIPKALVHFLKNNGRQNVSVISAFNSQFPGTQYFPTTLLSQTFHQVQEI